MENAKHEQQTSFEKQKPNNITKIIKAIGGIVILAAAAIGVDQYFEAKNNATPTPTQIEKAIASLPKNSNGIEYSSSIDFQNNGNVPSNKYSWTKSIPHSSGNYFRIDLFSNYYGYHAKLNLNKINEIEVNLNNGPSDGEPPYESLSLLVNQGKLIQSTFYNNFFRTGNALSGVTITGKGFSNVMWGSNISHKLANEADFNSRQVEKTVASDISNDIYQIVTDFKDNKPLPDNQSLISFSALLPTKN